jgi:hypothetical protein
VRNASNCDVRKGSLNGGCLGLWPSFQLVSSTPKNGLEMTLAPFKIWLCATEGCQCMARGAYPAHVG